MAPTMRTMTPAECQKIALQLLWEHGLHDWKIQFGNAYGRTATCYHTRQKIMFSKPLMEVRTHEGTLNTIRHEVAHALAGYEAGHGPSWSAIFKRLGGSGDRTFDPATMAAPEEGLGRYVGTCQKCGRVKARPGRPQVLRSCSVCNPYRFDATCLIEYRDRQGNLVTYGPRSARKSRPRKLTRSR